MLAAACATVLLLLQQRRDEALEAEVRQNTNLARAFDEQTTRVLENVNHSTLRLRDAVVKGGAATPDLVRYASETSLTPKTLVQLVRVDAEAVSWAAILTRTASRPGRWICRLASM